ncbi:MAG: acetyl-CoA carboxylase biotin carboxylase subunit [Luteibaculum sp.]
MKKILVANRGEIALRVMRSAREMGIKTVAVFSDADRTAPFVRYADEAYHIGPSPSRFSYLDIDKIIAVAKKAGVDGIHPGYGFLSENARFAERVSQEGITFIGPKPKSMEVMGSKLAAKEAVKAYNIPLVPGSDGAISDITEAIKIAEGIGFPLLVKASAGGGGKGMRIVNESSELKSQMERAISEAKSSFGDGAVFIEKFVSSPRHIEIQVLADTHGNCVYLFERECSVQRRHQKVIEEAPSAILTEDLRKQMGEAAVKVAQACDYIGAGTVEFLVDDQLNFYFLEMNTRLQVEHPVTEMITGVDLVKEQIEVARGKKLSFSQEDLKILGHAIEVRVYAEDPANNFLPDIGKLETYRIPKGPGIRVDDGFEEGMEIPIHYDPMIAKLVVHGATRQEAIDRMLGAIREYRITGIETTLPFCAFTLNHEAFRSGNFDTNFVKHYFKPEVLEADNEEEKKVAALIAQIIFSEKREEIKQNAHTEITGVSSWKLKR